MRRITRASRSAALCAGCEFARDRSRTPLVATTFTIDKIGKPFDFGDVTVASIATPEVVLELRTARDRRRQRLGHCRRVRLQHRLVRCADASPVASSLRDVCFAESSVDLTNRCTPCRFWRRMSGRRWQRSVEEVSIWLPAGCLHERFETWAKRAPERVAVVCDGESLSYGTLDRRANALAFRLQALGVARGRLGRACERSVR